MKFNVLSASWWMYQGKIETRPCYILYHEEGTACEVLLSGEITPHHNILRKLFFYECRINIISKIVLKLEIQTADTWQCEKIRWGISKQIKYWIGIWEKCYPTSAVPLMHARTHKHTQLTYLEQVEVSVELSAFGVFQSLELSGDEHENVLQTIKKNTVAVISLMVWFVSLTATEQHTDRWFQTKCFRMVSKTNFKRWTQLICFCLTNNLCLESSQKIYVYMWVISGLQPKAAHIFRPTPQWKHKSIGQLLLRECYRDDATGSCN